MFKAVLTVPCSSLGFADFPPGVHTDFRGSHTSLLSFKGHCSSQVCQSSLASPLCDINKATSSSARTRQETGPVASALKLPLLPFSKGWQGQEPKEGTGPVSPQGSAVDRLVASRKGNRPGHAWPQRKSITTRSQGPEALGSLITHLPQLSISSLA